MSLQSASNFAPHVDSIFEFLLITASIVAGIVWVAMVYLCVKYRRDSNADRKNPPQKSNKAEIIVISLIFIFGMGIFAQSAAVYYEMRNTPTDAIEVDVIAKQWMWMFHSAIDDDQINKLRVPLGRNIRLVMTSQDVIHSFFVPDFRLKQDVLPGRYTSLWFRADKLGRFEILCSQYCGLDHSNMRGVIEVVLPQDMKKGVAPINSELEHGKILFHLKACASCHGGEKPVAPDLVGLYQKKVLLKDGTTVVADENYIRRSILYPNAQIVQGYSEIMPTYRGQLSEEEILAIIRFIKSGQKP